MGEEQTISQADKDSQEQSIDRTVYVDMDGVLADFDEAFLNLSGTSSDKVADEEMWNVINAYGKSKFFIELPWMPGGKELWQYVTDNFLHVKILSALGKSDVSDGQTTTGKTSWLRKNIPSLRESDIILVPNKHRKRQYSRPGDIIIDDTPVVIAEWVKNGGIGILHKTSTETISKLKRYV